MCEYNRPYPVPFGHHPDDYLRPQTAVLPTAAWQRRIGELASGEVEIIERAIEDAAEIASDVHIYRSAATPVLGIALVPGMGPNVKVWEH